MAGLDGGGGGGGGGNPRWSRGGASFGFHQERGGWVRLSTKEGRECLPLRRGSQWRMLQDLQSK